jgi:hypothetical protein
MCMHFHVKKGWGEGDCAFPQVELVWWTSQGPHMMLIGMPDELRMVHSRPGCKSSHQGPTIRNMTAWDKGTKIKMAGKPLLANDQTPPKEMENC